jgi:kynurenine formamidase
VRGRAASPVVVSASLPWLTLADALEVIQSRELVDLTHRFSPSTPVWSGFGQATMTAACDPKTYRPYTIEQDGFRTTFYSLVGQYGTHVTPLLANDPNHALSVDDIKAWEKAHGRIAAGSFAALRTDMSKDWESNPERFKRYPFPAWSLAHFQIEAMTGLDKVPATGAVIVVTWPNVRHGLGFPARAFAILP